jgi:large-conductance mechanosensitive channel
MPIAVDWLHKNSLLLMGVLSILKQLKSRVQLNYHNLVQATINFVIVFVLVIILGAAERGEVVWQPG